VAKNLITKPSLEPLSASSVQDPRKRVEVARDNLFLFSAFGGDPQITQIHRLVGIRFVVLCRM